MRCENTGQCVGTPEPCQLDGNPGRAGGRQDVSDAVLWAEGVRKLRSESGNNSVMGKKGKGYI